MLLGVLAAVILAACSRDLRAEKSGRDEQQQPVPSTELQSAIRNEALVKAKVWRLGEDKDLIAIQSSDRSNTWVAEANGTVYGLSQNGKSLAPVSIDIPKGHQIASIFFADSGLGWAVTTRTPDDVLDSQGFESSILKTSDGGLHWETQFSGKGLSLRRIVFVDNQEGWVVGSRLVQKETLQNDAIVLHSTNQGQQWVDVSSGLNEHGAGSVEDIYAVPSKAIVLTNDRQILSTEDAGVSWRASGKVQDEPPQTNVSRIGNLKNNSVWVLGATGGREGTWSILATSHDSKSWKKFRTHDVFLMDAMFLSDLEVIACGTMPSNNELPLLADDHRYGVILRSTDSGLNWTVIYRDQKVRGINALMVEPAGYIWAVGEAGLVVRLDLRS